MYTVKQNDEDIKFLRNLNFQSVLVNDILMHLELKFIEREQCLEKKTFFGISGFSTKVSNENLMQNRGNPKIWHSVQ